MICRFLYQMTFYVATMIYTGRRYQKKVRTFEAKSMRSEEDHSVDRKPAMPKKCRFSQICCPKINAQRSNTSEYVMHKFFRTHWSRILMKKWTRICIAIFLFAYLVVSLYNTAKIEVNIQPQKIIPDNSRLIDVFKWNFFLFSFERRRKKPTTRHGRFYLNKSGSLQWTRIRQIFKVYNIVSVLFFFFQY